MKTGAETLTSDNLSLGSAKVGVVSVKQLERGQRGVGRMDERFTGHFGELGRPVSRPLGVGRGQQQQQHCSQ